MTNREKFIEEIDILIEKFNVSLSIEANTYFAELKDGKASVGGLTENGKAILDWLNTKERQYNFFSAKAIGEGLFASSRVISGAARKLITDGYLEKEGKNPVTYRITASGHNILLGSEQY
jgi:hypothetical protein